MPGRRVELLYVQPGRTAPASHCRGTTGNPFYRIFMPFSSTVITSTSIALPGISLVSVIFLPSSSRSTVSFFGLSSL
nr:MAG TPA: LydA-holin antagonist [Caudoviricetes sp.]